MLTEDMDWKSVDIARYNLSAELYGQPMFNAPHYLYHIKKTTMSKIQQHLQKKYFTDKVIEETAELIEEASNVEEKLDEIINVLKNASYAIGLRVKQLWASVDENNIEEHKEGVNRLSKALEEMSTKEMKQLLKLHDFLVPQEEKTEAPSIFN